MTSSFPSVLIMFTIPLTVLSLKSSASNSKIIITTQPESRTPMFVPFPVGIPFPHPVPSAHTIFIAVDRPVPVAVPVPSDQLSHHDFRHSVPFGAHQRHLQLPLYQDHGQPSFLPEHQRSPSPADIERDNIFANLQLRHQLETLANHHTNHQPAHVRVPVAWSQLADHQDHQQAHNYQVPFE
ncbi:hypothetical protein HDE_13993 [Halotydeus destructor]|nr:hypothetical protein HDE_13993 [Halotydeus destructor]